MAGSKSNYLSKKLLDAVLGQNSAIPGFSGAMTSVYVGLWTTAGSLSDTSTGATANEVSGGTYSRVAVTNNSTNWPAASGSTVATKTNGAAINFATASASWGTINQFAILDGSTEGLASTDNILYWSDLTTPKTIASGDTASFAVGALSITED